MAAPTSTPAPPPIEPALPRHIPGLVRPPAPTKSRSRAKKTGTKSVSIPAGDVASAVAAEGVAGIDTAPTASELPAALVVGGGEVEDGLIEKKTTSASEACAKRIRAATKKIQRIVTYEEKTEALNADQQKAVASKPTLEAIVKELQELLVILKAEEAEDDARLARVQATEEKRHSHDVTLATAAAKKEGESHLVVLLQFFHLHGLFTTQQSGFAPPVLPSVLAQASANDVAAVRCLFDGLTNGPLLGGHDDAVEKVAKVAEGSKEEIILGITYARIQELVAGLTSPPHNPAEPTPVTESDLPAGPSDSVTALVEGEQEEQTATPTFLQTSELVAPAAATPTSEEKVASWADDVDPTQAAAPLTNGHAETPAPIAEHTWGVPATGKPIDWSSEEQSTELPPLEGLEPEKKAVAPTVVAATATDGDAEGFQSVGGGNAARRGGRGGERGTFRGGRGGERGERRGSFRGRGRGGFEQGGERADRPPREGAGRGGFEGRGGFGGEGRGRGGRGRGGARGGSKPVDGAPTPAPVQRDW